ncbi:MAG: protein-L-isoaspartate O-methyltransferase [Myxococcales bacterium]|nr:protein-L-isoaspartate O-methyltransferase [Myxococcales bacterium]
MSPDELVRVLVAKGVRDARVLDAFRTVPRKSFVPPEEERDAYVDVPVRIPHEQVTTQPSLMALMVEALELRGHERVLEVGTGLGFQTAILATLSREVVSIERFADLAATSRRNLASVGIENAIVIVGDGSLGVPEHAPYDAIVTAAAAPRVPPALVEELSEGGRLVHPLGPGGHEVVIAWRKQDGKLVTERDITLAYFVPMVGAFGAHEDRR